MHLISQFLNALDGCSFAAIRTLFSKGPRAARKVIGATLAASRSNPHIHTMNCWDLVRGFAVGEEVVICSDSWFDGTIAPLERCVLTQLIRYHRPKTIVEVGTYRGTTTKIILDNCQPDAKVFTIDLPLEQEIDHLQAATDKRLIVHRQVGIDYQQHSRVSQVTQIYGDSFDPATWNKIPDEIEFALIDASHSYEAVKNDSERVFNKLKADGIVMWHDYTESETQERGVGKYIRELMQTRNDIFICADTDFALRIPEQELHKAAVRVPVFFPNGDYSRRFPGGPIPWLTELP